MTPFRFELIHRSKKSKARVGRIHTAHGIIDTPNFVGVGTNGTMKALDNSMVDKIGLQRCFATLITCCCSPELKPFEKLGAFINLSTEQMPIITDSGGFQVFSLAYGSVANELKSRGTKQQGGGSVLKINEDGVVFRSYYDGRKILLTPESSIQAQKDLGADIIIPFDELPPYHISPEALKKSLARTHRWEKRSLDVHLKNPQGQAIYAVIHGGVDLDMRKESCNFLTNLPFDGYAVGGSLGKTKDELYKVAEATFPWLPDDKPNHLLGIGDLPSLDMCIPYGIDTFDSSYPTRSARHGVLFTANGPLNINKLKNATDFSPIEAGCSCPTCSSFSAGYLHHLFKAREITGMTLASIHNLHYMVKLMEKYRQAILEDRI